jgi:hypothetical protein
MIRDTGAITSTFGGAMPSRRLASRPTRRPMHSILFRAGRQLDHMWRAVTHKEEVRTAPHPLGCHEEFEEWQVVEKSDIRGEPWAVVDGEAQERLSSPTAPVVPTSVTNAGWVERRAISACV